MRSTLAIAAAATVLALAAAAPAQAAFPKRTYFCGANHISYVTVTVLSQQKIRVKTKGFDEGDYSGTMRQQGNGYHFTDGEYEIFFPPDQGSLKYTAPDFGKIGCSWTGH